MYLLIMLICLPLSLFAMDAENHQLAVAPNLNAGRNRLLNRLYEATKDELFSEFVDKRNFLSRCHASHENLRAFFEFAHVLTRKYNQPHNRSLINKLLDDGFLTIPVEVTAQHSTQQREIVYEYLKNTTTFFRLDDEIEGDLEELNSSSTVKAISSDEELLSSYIEARESKETKEAVDQFANQFTKRLRTIGTRYGIKYPNPEANGAISITGFLAINEENIAVHAAENYPKIKALAATHAILALYLDTFGLSPKETEKKLKESTQPINELTQKIRDSLPKNDCTIL